MLVPKISFLPVSYWVQGWLKLTQSWISENIFLWSRAGALMGSFYVLYRLGGVDPRFIRGTPCLRHTVPASQTLERSKLCSKILSGLELCIDFTRHYILLMLISLINLKPSQDTTINLARAGFLRTWARVRVLHNLEPRSLLFQKRAHWGRAWPALEVWSIILQKIKSSNGTVFWSETSKGCKNIRTLPPKYLRE